MTLIDARGIPRALFASGAGLRARLEAWDSAIRGPVGSVRRVGFVHLDPGVGATTLARETTRLVAERRTEPVLVVDVAPTGSLATRLGADVTPPSELRAYARTSADAASGLATGADGERVLRPPRSTTDATGAWLDEASPISRFFDVAITDFGPRHPAVDMASAAALCDVVCLVSRADRGPAELSRSLAGAIADLPESPRVVLALNDMGSTAGRAPEAVAAHSPDTVVRIPRDAGLASGERARTLRARVALLELSAALIAGGAA